MIRAVLFDFNGVVVDDEPVHFQLFQRVLEEEGMELKKKDYFEMFLGMDDHDCLIEASTHMGNPLSEEKIQEVTDRKNRYYAEEVYQNPPFVPGVLEFIQELGKTHFLGVVSGALRSEIEELLKIGGVMKEINVIVAAGEVEQGKPDPQGFIRGMELLNRDFVASSERLLPEECLAFEDSSWGVEAALGAGMSVVGLNTTYQEKELPGALIYLKDFSGVQAPGLLNQVEAKL